MTLVGHTFLQLSSYFLSINCKNGMVVKKLFSKDRVLFPQIVSETSSNIFHVLFQIPMNIFKSVRTRWDQQILFLWK